MIRVYQRLREHSVEVVYPHLNSNYLINGIHHKRKRVSNKDKEDMLEEVRKLKDQMQVIG